MKVTGIIAEYNPFHNGHSFHLKQARERLGSDYIVVVMSGNYVQRGAPTIIDKHSRCEMALRCGADLVLELPTCFSTASAEYFAFGGVSILDKLGIVDSLCFGTESLDGLEGDEAKENLLRIFNEIADLRLNETPEFKEKLREGMGFGLSHAAAVSYAVGKILGDNYEKVLETSNNILGVEYVKSLKRLNSRMTPEPTPRMMSAHKDSVIMEGFSSATSIRNAIFNNYDPTSLSATVPAPVAEILMDRYLVSFPVFRDDFSTLLGARIIDAKCAEEYTKYFGINQDLANRIFKYRNEFRSFNQFRELLNCRSISKATVGRALMHIALDITEADMDHIYNTESITAVRMLGFRRSAEPLLSAIKKNSSIRLVSKLADYEPQDDVCDMIQQSIELDKLYRMICMNKFDVDIKTPYEEPVIIIE